jgi:radical SAM superfamily enzyme YgiQ (UPF0313 family)
MFYGGMSNAIPRMYAVAAQYQSRGVPTIAGGSHVDALPREALESGIDVVVHGEGEEAAKELVRAIMPEGRVVKDFKKKLGDIPGLSFLDERKRYVFTGHREPIKDLNALEDPDLGIIKFMKKDWSAIPISRGRGCNHRCEFCVVNKQFGAYKAASVHKAFGQIRYHAERGVRRFFIVDDNFAQSIPEAIELCKLVGDYRKASGNKLGIMVQVRTEVAEHDELVEAMRYAGITSLAIGYESPINEDLKAMRKGVTVEKLASRSKKLSQAFHLRLPFFRGLEIQVRTEPSAKSQGVCQVFQDGEDRHDPGIQCRAVAGLGAQDEARG